MQNSPGQAGGRPDNQFHIFHSKKRSPQSVTAKWVVMANMPVRGLRWKIQEEKMLLERKRKPPSVQEWLGFIPYQFEWSYPFFGGERKKAEIYRYKAAFGFTARNHSLFYCI